MEGDSSFVSQMRLALIILLINVVFKFTIMLGIEDDDDARFACNLIDCALCV